MDILQVACTIGFMRWIDKVYRLANERGLTLVELGKLVGVEGPRFPHWKSGKGEPTLTKAIALAANLGVGLDYLFSEELAAAGGRPSTEAPRTTGEQLILETVKELGLTPGEAMVRLAKEGPGKGSRDVVAGEYNLPSNYQAPGNPGAAKVNESPRGRK